MIRLRSTLVELALMTQKQQIMVLVQQGLDSGEIARRLGCRREYVRLAKRRLELDRVEKSGRAEPKALTLQAKIVALVDQGLGDGDICAACGVQERVYPSGAATCGIVAPGSSTKSILEACRS
jgi:transcriptional regulator